MVRFGWVVFAVTGCMASSEEAPSDHAMGEFEAFLEVAEMLTTAHVDAVSAAATLDEASGAEAAYLGSWTPLSVELDTVLAELQGCELAGDGAAALDDTATLLEALGAEMDAHATAHAACATLEDCVTAEDAHETAMMDGIDGCKALHEQVHDLISCAPAESHDHGTMSM